MKIDRRHFLILLMCYSLQAAAVSYYCPTTAQTIGTGDHIEDVRKRCGNPATEELKNLTTQKNVTIMRWVYAIIPTVDSKHPDPNKLLAAIPVMEITFKNQKVTEIKKNNLLIPIPPTLYCTGGNAISIGDSDYKVQLMCGSPTFRNIENVVETVTKPVKIWTYNYGPYQPQVSLQFENDVLTEIQTGQLGH